MNKIIPAVILICAVIIITHTIIKDESQGTPVNNIIYESSVDESAIQTATSATGEVFIDAPTEAVMEGRKVLDVPYYSQEDYPTGCELVSSSMLLAYYGFDTTAGDLIDGGYIAESAFYEVEGIRYGGNPQKQFIGSPYDASSYGCYSGAIMNMLSKYLSGTGYTPLETTGAALSQLCTDYINNGIPVLVWASIDMKETYVNESNTWVIEDTGESFTWRSNEHCLVLVGYDDFNYYFNDPMNGKSYTYEKKLSEQRHSELGKQSIVLIGN